MFRGIFDDVKTAGRESLETMGEGVGASLAGLFGGSQASANEETHAPAAVGDDGKGGRVVENVQPSVAQPWQQMPGWVVPVGVGIAGVMTFAVVFSVVRR